MRTVDTRSLYTIQPAEMSTSKGNQPKWFDNEYWYKEDYMGYEALAETVIAQLLQKSNAKEIADITIYELVYLADTNEKKIGCCSTNFQQNGERFVSLERLHRTFCGKPLYLALRDIMTPEEKIRYTVDFVTDTTKLTNFGPYLAMLLQADAFFLNEDRHTNNIAVIHNDTTETYRLCPIFDNGLSLLADTSDYSLDTSVYANIQRVPAKPFTDSFEDQAMAAESLYDTHLKFAFSRQDLRCIMETYRNIYSNTIIERVYDTICAQMRKYSYMFQ